jgi:hypothetical protein
MIEVTDRNGRVHLLNPDGIVRVTSRWSSSTAASLYKLSAQRRRKGQMGKFC